MGKATRSRSAPTQADPAPLADKRRSTLFVTSFEKGLRVLAAFGRDRPQMGLRELCDATGLDASSVQRFAYTLHALGFLQKDERSRKYSLTPRVLDLGFAYLQSSSLIESATPLLYEANQQCGETLSLTELVGTEIVYVARAPGRHVISVDVLLGTRLPAFAAAAGRAFLAFMDRAAARAIIARSDLRKLTPHTEDNPARLLAQLDRIARKGYALASEQCYVGDISAAAPIFGPDGQPVAALNVSVPSSRWTGRQMEAELVPLLLQTAARMAQRLGGVHSVPWFIPTIPASTARERPTSPVASAPASLRAPPTTRPQRSQRRMPE